MRVSAYLCDCTYIDALIGDVEGTVTEKHNRRAQNMGRMISPNERSLSVVAQHCEDRTDHLHPTPLSSSQFTIGGLNGVDHPEAATRHQYYEKKRERKKGLNSSCRRQYRNQATRTTLKIRRQIQCGLVNCLVQ